MKRSTRPPRGQLASTPPPKSPAPRGEPLLALLRGDAFRHVLLGGLVALLVVLPLVPGELGAITGQGLLAVGLALFLAALWWLHALLQRPIGVRVAAIDGAVFALVAWHTLAALRAVWQESPRPAMNMMWYWIGLAVCYFLLRQLVGTATERRAVVAVLVALTVALAAYGLYQFQFEIRASQRRYEAAPDRVLREAGLWSEPGSPERQLFENRLYSVEPTATFALTNSLAGVLAPWLVVLTGLTVAGFPVTDSRSDRRALAARFALAGAAALVAFCLVLTKSRGAYAATLVGSVAIAWFAWRALARSESARRIQRRLLLGTVGAAAVGGLLIAAAMAFGGLDREVLTEAGKSLGYRLEYWRSTARMIADRPILGYGPGNFQYAYTYYKLPQASEEIADPHNFLFEVAATAGLPALVAMLVALVLAARSAFATHLHAAEPQDCANSEDESTKPSRAILAIFMGAVAGLVLAIPVGGPDAPWSALLIVTPVFLAMLPILRGWVERGTLHPWLLAVAAAVLLVHLLAAGGIGTLGVAGGLWSLLALLIGQNVTAERPRRLPVAAAVALLVAIAIVANICTYTAILPVARCRALLDAAGTLPPPRQPTPTQLATAATEADPYSDAAWRTRASWAFHDWQAAPRPEAWQQVQACRTAALANNPRSASLRAMFGDFAMEVFSQSQDAAVLAQAVADFRQAVQLYPNSAQRHADLAFALALQGDRAAAVEHADRAIELDAIITAAGHDDKRLRPATVDALQNLLSSP